MDFYYQIEHIPSGAIEVCAEIKTFSQISTPETICISVAGKIFLILRLTIGEVRLTYCHYSF